MDCRIGIYIEFGLALMGSVLYGAGTVDIARARIWEVAVGNCSRLVLNIGLLFLVCQPPAFMEETPESMKKHIEERYLHQSWIRRMGGSGNLIGLNFR